MSNRIGGLGGITTLDFSRVGMPEATSHVKMEMKICEWCGRDFCRPVATTQQTGLKQCRDCRRGGRPT